jgi:hypothetical protein
MKASLSIAFENLRGKAGTLVVSKARSGLFVRPAVTGKNPRTAAQQAIRANFSKAAAALKNLTTAQLVNWQNYAQTIVRTNPTTGETYHPTAGNVFLGLATKFLQVNPTGTIPTTPPAAAFNGDSLTVTTTGASGKITFTATAANTPNTKTELLLQPLPSRNRAPNPRAYRTKAFATFALGSLSVDVTVPPGYYAAAYRFVNTTTGQETLLQPIPTQQVTFTVEEGGKKAA